VTFFGPVQAQLLKSGQQFWDTDSFSRFLSCLDARFDCFEPAAAREQKCLLSRIADFEVGNVDALRFTFTKSIVCFFCSLILLDVIDAYTSGQRFDCTQFCSSFSADAAGTLILCEMVV
jgi:hypothetical protein